MSENLSFPDVFNGYTNGALVHFDGKRFRCARMSESYILGLWNKIGDLL